MCARVDQFCVSGSSRNGLSRIAQICSQGSCRKELHVRFRELISAANYLEKYEQI